MNSVPLSVKGNFAVSYRNRINSRRESLIIFPFANLKAWHSIHFVNKSWITRIYTKPALLRGKGPMISAATAIHSLDNPVTHQSRRPFLLVSFVDMSRIFRHVQQRRRTYWTNSMLLTAYSGSSLFPDAPIVDHHAIRVTSCLNSCGTTNFHLSKSSMVADVTRRGLRI